MDDHYRQDGFMTRSTTQHHGKDEPTITSPTDALPIACRLGDRELALRSETLRRELFALADRRRELPDGYAFQFAGSDDLMAKVNAFVATERRCCSFFRIELVFEPGLGPIWLHLSGPEGVKRFVEDTFDNERVFTGRAECLERPRPATGRCSEARATRLIENGRAIGPAIGAPSVPKRDPGRSNGSQELEATDTQPSGISGPQPIPGTTEPPPPGRSRHRADRRTAPGRAACRPAGPSCGR